MKPGAELLDYGIPAVTLETNKRRGRAVPPVPVVRVFHPDRKSGPGASRPGRRHHEPPPDDPEDDPRRAAHRGSRPGRPPGRPAEAEHPGCHRPPAAERGREAPDQRAPAADRPDDL